MTATTDTRRQFLLNGDDVVLHFISKFNLNKCGPESIPRKCSQFICLADSRRSSRLSSARRTKEERSYCRKNSYFRADDKFRRGADSSTETRFTCNKAKTKEQTNVHKPIAFKLIAFLNHSRLTESHSQSSFFLRPEWTLH